MQEYDELFNRTVILGSVPCSLQLDPDRPQQMALALPRIPQSATRLLFYFYF